MLKLFLRALEACYQVETFERVFDLLIARGFRLIADGEEEEYENVVPEVTPALRRDLNEYLAHRKERLFIQVYLLGDVDFRFVLLPVQEEGMLVCQVNYDYIRSNEARVFYPIMLETFKDLYHACQSFYGHQDYDGGISLSRKAVIQDQSIGYLYYINLFGPELVKKLGRDRLLSAPAWRVEELGDGGIFLVPEDHLAIGGGGHSLKKVADHLGMSTPQAPGEEWDEYEYEP